VVVQVCYSEQWIVSRSEGSIWQEFQVVKARGSSDKYVSSDDVDTPLNGDFFIFYVNFVSLFIQ
jgi:hypothetical protein